MIQRGRPLSDSNHDFTYELPPGYEHGFCDTCKRRFEPDPRMTKQFTCQSCRSAPVQEPSYSLAYQQILELRLKPGFVSDILDGCGKTVELANRVGVSTTTLNTWNKRGIIPGCTGSVQKLCDALGLTREQLEQRYGR